MSHLVECINCHRHFGPGQHINNHIQTCVAQSPYSAANPSSASEANASPKSLIARLFEKKDMNKTPPTLENRNLHWVGNPKLYIRNPQLYVVNPSSTDAVKTLGNPAKNSAKKSSAKGSAKQTTPSNAASNAASVGPRSSHERVVHEFLKTLRSPPKGGSNRQKYRKTKKTQKLRHKKHHRKTHRVRV